MKPTVKVSIYLIYFLILVGAMSYRLVSASDTRDICIISDLQVVSQPDGFLASLKLNSMRKPVINYCSVENSVSLQFGNARLADSLVDSPFASKEIKLAYFTQNKEKKTVKARIFFNSQAPPKIRVNDGEVVIRLTNLKTRKNFKISKKELMNPNSAKNAPVVLNLVDAPLRPVLHELARNAGLNLRLSGKLPARLSLALDASDPMTAIRKLADVSKSRLINHGDHWNFNGQGG